GRVLAKELPVFSIYFSPLILFPTCDRFTADLAREYYRAPPFVWRCCPQKRVMASTTKPAQPDTKRELAAIMFSDIAGYTALMGRDEHSAIHALDTHRETLRSILPKYNGRLIGEIGDGTLSSFHSAIDAVNCAREVQALTENNPELCLR